MACRYSIRRGSKTVLNFMTKSAAAVSLAKHLSRESPGKFRVYIKCDGMRGAVRIGQCRAGKCTSRHKGGSMSLAGLHGAKKR